MEFIRMGQYGPLSLFNLSMYIRPNCRYVYGLHCYQDRTKIITLYIGSHSYAIQLLYDNVLISRFEQDARNYIERVVSRKEIIYETLEESRRIHYSMMTELRLLPIIIKYLIPSSNIVVTPSSIYIDGVLYNVSHDVSILDIINQLRNVRIDDIKIPDGIRIKYTTVDFSRKLSGINADVLVGKIVYNIDGSKQESLTSIEIAFNDMTSHYGGISFTNKRYSVFAHYHPFNNTLYVSTVEEKLFRENKEDIIEMVYKYRNDMIRISRTWKLILERFRRKFKYAPSDIFNSNIINNVALSIYEEKMIYKAGGVERDKIIVNAIDDDDYDDYYD